MIDLPEGMPLSNLPRTTVYSGSNDVPYTEALDQFERELLRGLLVKHAGAVDEAAREAGMNIATVYRKIKKYQIKKEEYSA